MSRECCGPDPVESPDPVDLAIEPMPPLWRDRALALPATSGLMLLLGYALSWSGQETIGLILHVIGLGAGAWTFAPGALRQLARGFLGVGLLMTIAAAGAVALGHVGEAAALAFLFSIAEGLEDRAMDRAKRGLSALLALIPHTARVSRDGRDVQEMPVEQIRAGDVLIVGAGERVATDGTVLTGRSSLDTSAMTGESIPVEIGPGAEVLAGSVNGSGSLTIAATADGTDNSLTTIVRLVNEAHATKGARARLADTIARPLVPLVLVTAALVAIIGSAFGDPATWIERALVVLVAASPCALAIAVPVTVISAIGSASRLGVIIKSGEAFERFGTIKHVAIDKTGTLTRNQPIVAEIAATEGITSEDVLTIAASLERTSSHPLAAAITQAQPGAPVAVALQEHPGRGLSGRIDDTPHRIGNPDWIDPGPLRARAEQMASLGMSLVVVERDDLVIGLIGVRDELRPEAAETVETLKSAGIAVTMLTGDNPRTANALAAQAGITNVAASQLPVEKARAVHDLSNRTPTAMIGDGINDAPALATATVGIAMGATGSAAAVESADIAFTGHDLRQIPAAIAHAKRGRRIMTGNIILAIAIIVALFPLALFGVLGLAGVVLVHEIAEVLVIGNGVRAARTQAQHEPPPPIGPDPCSGHCCTSQPGEQRPTVTLSPAISPGASPTHNP